jgi:folylpolyglutamate synthase/dihydropteroate synthase
LFADKDYEKMLRALLTDSMFKIAGIVATEPPSERKLDAETLAKTAERIMVHNRGEAVVIAEADVDAAMKKALRMAEEKKALICACGSLYLASGVKSAVHDLLG